ncbi:kinase-like protein, partial [Macrolepiota fuliginosa MF-IS2]
RLLRESRLWSRLRHPYIAPFYDLVFEQGYPVLVMPYYENGDLNITSHLLPYLDSGNIIQICEAAAGLEYLHNLKSRAVTHGDIKVHNILVTKEWHARLADFGASRIIGPPASTSSPITGPCR